MWNHAPAMWSAMSARATSHAGDLDEQAAADLFAYFYSTRFFEKPGDAARGKRVFADRGCAGCHGLDAGNPARHSARQPMGEPEPSLRAQRSHVEPHAAHAGGDGGKRVSWPALSGQDLSDLLVYLRNLPSTREYSAGFRCHLRRRTAPRSSARKAARIAISSGHGSRRVASADARSPKSPRRCGIMAHAWPRLERRPRDVPARRNARTAELPVGASVLRRCRATLRAAGASSSPNVAPAAIENAAAPRRTLGGGHAFSGPAMIAALWRHGPAMLERMKSQRLAWPRLARPICRPDRISQLPRTRRKP